MSNFTAVLIGTAIVVVILVVVAIVLTIIEIKKAE